MTAVPPSFPSLLADRRIIVVVRDRDAAVAEAIARASVAAGLRAIEITMTVPQAPSLIATLRAALASDVLVGAGTVLSVAQLDAVVAAGAQFVVAPGLDPLLVESCAAARVPVLPGALTPTEVMTGCALGLDAFKLFPSDSCGVAHLRALRAVFAHVAFVPTGGVSSANAADWFAAGAHALGMAGEFSAAYRAGGEAAVMRLARQLSQAFETYSSSRSISAASR